MIAVCVAEALDATARGSRRGGTSAGSSDLHRRHLERAGAADDEHQHEDRALGDPAHRASGGQCRGHQRERALAQPRDVAPVEAVRDMADDEQRA